MCVCSIGAFGVVHKGEMISSDGTVKAVAIKTIKCEIIKHLHIHTYDMTHTYIAHSYMYM